MAAVAINIWWHDIWSHGRLERDHSHNGLAKGNTCIHFFFDSLCHSKDNIINLHDVGWSMHHSLYQTYLLKRKNSVTYNWITWTPSILTYHLVCVWSGSWHSAVWLILCYCSIFAYFDIECLDICQNQWFLYTRNKNQWRTQHNLQIDHQHNQIHWNTIDERNKQYTSRNKYHETERTHQKSHWGLAKPQRAWV